MRACIRLTRGIFAKPALDPYRGEEIAPGPATQSDADLDAFIRETVQPAYHACGTCRMGPASAPASVVGMDGRLHGVEGSRVIDSPIIPSIVTGNLNACAIMLAEKTADAVRGRAPLPPEDVPVFVNPEWQTRQR